MNVLSEVFTKIQYIQSSQDKQFPKALLLSKADKIFAGDMAAVERNGYDPMLYALEKFQHLRIVSLMNRQTIKRFFIEWVNFRSIQIY